jgi:hypothetical protein
MLQYKHGWAFARSHAPLHRSTHAFIQRPLRHSPSLHFDYCQLKGAPRSPTIACTSLWSDDDTLLQRVRVVGPRPLLGRLWRVCLFAYRCSESWIGDHARRGWMCAIVGVRGRPFLLLHCQWGLRLLLKAKPAHNGIIIQNNTTRVMLLRFPKEKNLFAIRAGRRWHEIIKPPIATPAAWGSQLHSCDNLLSCCGCHNRMLHEQALPMTSSRPQNAVAVAELLTSTPDVPCSHE